MSGKPLLLVTLFALVIGLAACGTRASPEPTLVPSPGPTPPPTAAPEEAGYTPSFEKADCPFQVPAGQVEGRTVECGYLIVPEDRSAPSGRTLRLAVAIFHPIGEASEPDPIVYLAGGPGGSALENLDSAFRGQFAWLLAAHRDLVLLDQRGVGFSQPALDCPEAHELELELLDHELGGKLLTAEEMDNLLLESYRTCQQKLSEIADLHAYNTAASAADVNDLRLALGYDRINLWGVSYGTRLALGVMRDYPDGLRSAVLDSAYPPDVDATLESPANLDRALDLLFEGCAADPACAAAYPNLRQVFFETVDHLNEDPAETTIMHPSTGHRYPVRLSGDDLILLVWRLLYGTRILPELPKLIYEASQGSPDAIIRRATSWLFYEAYQGMSYSLHCNEEVSFSSWEQFQDILVDYPDLAGLFQGSSGNQYQICAVWDSGSAPPGENEPVFSDVPALIMSGEHDPITPPAWGQHAAETLKNGHFYVYPGVGHGASMVEGCPRDMMIAFILDPTSAPDYACIGGEPLEMEFFSDPTLGIRGFAPDRWTETAPGVYERGSSAADKTVLVLGKEPGTGQDLLARLASERGFEANHDRVQQVESGHFTWDLYAMEMQGLSLDLALAEEGESAYYVLLVAEPKQRDWLCDKVFWPAVKRLNPID